MSLVGLRLDVSGYYDILEGENRKILELRPGITSTASLIYFEEEVLLAQQEFPLAYKDKVLSPDEVKINLAYY